MFEVSKKTVEVCQEAFTRFVGTGLYIGLFLMSILYVISFMKKNDKKQRKIKIILGFYSIIIFILNLFPVFTKFITTILKETSTYWRVYWLLPLGISIAFMFTEMIYHKEKKIEKAFTFVLIICVIVISGNYMYHLDSKEFIKVGNYYKVPDSVLDVIEYISKDEGDFKRLVGSEPFLVYTRQIDGNIMLPEARDVSAEYKDWSIVSIIKGGDLKDICDYCRSNNCNYLVLGKLVQFPNEYLLGYDIKKVYENDDYSLYKFNRILED